MTDLQYYADEAKEQLQEEIKSGDHTQSELYDMVNEIADSNTPVYYGDVLEVASNDYAVALTIPEC